MLNPYVDCNCVNSVYVVHSQLFKDATGNQISPSTLAQTNDGKCTLAATAAWKPQKDKAEKICFNLISTANITATDSGNVNMSQSCDGGKPPPPPPVVTPDAVKTDTAATAPATNNMMLYIGGGIGLLILLIIIFFMFSGKRRSIDTDED